MHKILHCWYFCYIFQTLYYIPLSLDGITDNRSIRNELIQSTAEYMAEYSQRLKTHLFLHVADHFTDFGPSDCYNTERYILRWK